VREDPFVRVTAEPIDVDAVAASVADPAAGGTCVFVGTVRDHSDAGAVTGITYEAWEELATARLSELAADVARTWPVRRISIVHRHGELAVGDASVAIAVSAEHRAEAFDACREVIERLKRDVPIWKQEHLVSGESAWVMGS
jgi:molybdopterin synthase catalytic subunit